MSPRLSRAAGVLAVGIVYFLAAELGLSMAFETEHVTLVWPPTGIALAALILLGRGVWPGVALGAFAANAIANEPLATAAAVAVGNTLEAVTAAWLLRRVGFQPSLERIRDVLALVVFACVVSPIVSATIGVVSLVLGELASWTQFGLLWWMWWLGDAMGALVVAPPILTWARWSRRRAGWPRVVEGAALVAALVASGAFVFAGWRSPVPDEALEYFVFPFLIWAAIRFGQRITTLVVLSSSVLAIWGTVHGYGPFVTESPTQSLILLQIFLAIVAVTGLTIAASTAERRAVDRRVRESHEVLTAVAEGTTDAVFVKDLAGRYLMINPAGARLLGKSVDEVLGRDDLQLFSPDTARVIVRRDASLMASGTTETYEEVGTAAGVTRTYLSTKGPYRDEDGNVAGIIGISRDISERKQSEELLKKESALRKAIEDSMPAGVALVDLEGRQTYVNPAFCRIVGFSEEELLGATPPFPYWPPEDVAAIETTFEAALRGEQPAGGVELRFMRRGGERFDALVLSSKLEDSHGEASGWLASVSDISDRKRAEEERTRLLQHEKELRGEADAANRQKDEFLGMLAHELRNPLAPIRHALEIVRTDRDAKMLDWVLDVIDRQTHHLTRLVDDLLDVSRITRGRIELQKEPVDLLRILRQAVEASESYVASLGHSLEVSTPEEPLPLFADVTRLEQVFVNLLNNAAKYTDPKGRISVSVDRRGGEAVVRVRDNGVGIPPDLLTGVFDLFRQADRTLARSQGGLGVGLTVVRKLVELHEGRVEARSAGEGRGSEFVVRLPLQVAPEANERTAAAIEPTKPRRRVLLVEDDLDSARSLAKWLEIQGHEIRLAQDGPAALESASQFRPEVVILDIGLPGMDGYELARRLRSDGGNMLIVALTGYGRDADRLRSREAGFDEFLVKPVQPDRLLSLFAALA